MCLKHLLCLLAYIIFLSSRVSSIEEEFPLVKGFYAKPLVSTPPVASPVKPPTVYSPPPQIPVMPPTPATPILPPPPLVPSKPPTLATPPPQVPAKAPALAPPPAPVPPKTRLDCIPLCVDRCKLHSRKRLCARACMTCCERCKCVPPGTYGNREKCGKCYTDMTTRGGKRKCP